jgi:peptidyl-prolyl cis-trans isomerase B (cyclophilin B)
MERRRIEERKMNSRGRIDWKHSGWELLALGMLALLLACGGADDAPETPDHQAYAEAKANSDAAKEAQEDAAHGDEGAAASQAAPAVARAKARDFDWPDEPSAVIVLDVKEMGEIRIAMYEELAPKTVAHVIRIAQRGLYDESIFHRVIEDFMIQTGDPGTKPRPPGTLIPNYPNIRVEDEYNDTPHARGVVSMANRGTANTAETQFFIVQRDSPYLDGEYTAFGRVIAGMDVVDEIAGVEVDKFGRWGSSDRPLDNVVLTKVVVESRRTGSRGVAAGDGAADDPGDSRAAADVGDGESAAEVAGDGLGDIQGGDGQALDGGNPAQLAPRGGL